MTNVMSNESEKARALRMLEEAVAVRGEDFNYREHFNIARTAGAAGDCKYVHEKDGELIPGCIIGMMLHNTGVPLVEITEHEGRAASDVLPHFMHFANPSVRSAFDSAQARQDSGGTWGEALAAARERLDSGV